jgi:hypothetical protein
MCRSCCLPLMVNELVVQVGRFMENEGYFHPRCVTCSLCGELLVDLRCYADVGWVCLWLALSPGPVLFALGFFC